jgi:AsmA-like C-terminal region
VGALREAGIQDHPSNRGVRVWKGIGLALATLVVLAAVAAAYLRRFSPIDRNWVVKALSEHYVCDVELNSFSSSLFPAVAVSGEGLVLRRRDQPGSPPMAVVQRFSVTANWLGLLRHPRHLEQIRLEGFSLNIPPRRSSPATAPAQSGSTRKRWLPARILNDLLARRSGAAKRKSKLPPFVFDNVVADGTTLSVFSSKPDRPPTVFDIQRLRLRSAGVGPPMRFEAVLTNPRPAGQIHSIGTFGPWNADDPSLTPVKGQYTFQHADLSTIRGLRGMLASEGTYDGLLSHISVHGTTDTPDFALAISSNPVHLQTRFDALVDGVNGNTLLQPVTARLLSSTIVARGGVTKAMGERGRTIQLQVTASPARLEDLLRLAMKSSTPSMTGNVRIQGQLDLPPGEEDISRRMNLDCDFHIDSARFTDPQTETKIRTISRIGLGKYGPDASESAPLSLTGHILMANGVAKFSRLDFSVPGASLQLHGSFGLDSQALDFQGTANLQATVSQMTTGVKSVLLRALDPLLARNGFGISVPIHITGTRNSPSIELEIGKIFRRHLH